jgi:hypothetical protein
VKKIGWVIGLLLFSALACKALAPAGPLQDETAGSVDLPTRSSSTVATLQPTRSAPPVATGVPSESPLGTETVAPEIDLPSDTRLPSETPLPTYTAPSTATTEPTATPTGTPTLTTTPTASPTIPQYPIVFSGSGGKVLEVNKWQGPAIARFTHTGLSYFTVESFDSSGKHIEFLVDTIGDYSGTVPVDFDQTATRRLTINADGTWGIQFLPVTSAQIVPVPGTITGKGQQVFSLVGQAPDIISVDASQASGTFLIQVYGYKPGLVYLGILVNGVAPFTGAFIAPSGASLLAVTASGTWKIDITGK